MQFDWYMKRMLRDKANFGVLEGLLSVLLGEPIRIKEILESESNKDYARAKYNRVDVKAKDSKGDIIIIEVQLTEESDFLERILFGTSKVVIEHIAEGQKYKNIKKVYSVNILYFNLGEGKDYLYHGTTSFRGVHTGDELRITRKEKKAVMDCSVKDIYPEYYLIRVNAFNKIAKTPLEEWVSFLKTGEIDDKATAPGISEARKRLSYLSLSRAEQDSYDVYALDTASAKEDERIRYERAKDEGHEAGLKEGLAEGRKKEREALARKMKAKGLPKEMIREITGL